MLGILFFFKKTLLKNLQTQKNRPKAVIKYIKNLFWVYFIQNGEYSFTVYIWSMLGFGTFAVFEIYSDCAYINLLGLDG